MPKQKLTLIVNAGSSSLKFKLFDLKLKPILVGQAEKIGQRDSFFSYEINRGQKTEHIHLRDQHAALQVMLQMIHEVVGDESEIVRVGHRVVHGGEVFVDPTIVTSEVIAKLCKLNGLAPLHNPYNIAGIEACLRAFPKAKNYAVFDTAFHSTIPDFAHLYPLPYSVYRKYHIRRYGFHGLSHQFLTLEASKLLKKSKPNLITCHLGSGCSITAIKEGKSVDTSMGFTPLEGLMMNTRSGDIDPSIPLYLHEQGLGSERIKRMLNYESGLQGVSGLKDMRDIMLANGYDVPGSKLKHRLDADEKYLARLALAMFIYRIRKYIGAYSVVLGSVDAIVFSGGIGERNADVRRLVLHALPFKSKTLVIPANEELQIARLIFSTGL